MLNEPRDDDSFRTPGSLYEHDEPIAFAVVAVGLLVDWALPGAVPPHRLWVPETLFEKIRRGTLLATLELNAQNRLGWAEAEALAIQLLPAADKHPDPDVRRGAALVRAVALESAARPGTELLVEGP